MKIPILTLTAGLLAGFVIGLLVVGPKQKDSDMRRVAEIQHMIALSAQFSSGNDEAAQKSIIDLSESTISRISDQKIKVALAKSLENYRQTLQKIK